MELIITVGERKKRDQEDIKNVEISTKKEWVNIEEKVEKGVDNYPIRYYIIHVV